MGTRKTYLATQHLSVGYRTGATENRLFSDLALALREGEMICFMGPNGTGKSSLLRTLAGLQQPLSGAVTFGGDDNGVKEHHIAVVLTDRVQATNLTVEEVVTFGRYPYLGWDIRLSDQDRAIIRRSIDQVHVKPLLGKKLYELSDGQLQMVMIARALAQNTAVMLLDEPTAHLDLNNRVEIMNLLKELSRTTGKAILLATHELDLALQTADRIWLAGQGQDIVQGLPEDLVLNGTFDEVFRFKGFDLKSGRVIHESFRNTPVQLLGEGPPYLWTKNALERNGYEVTAEHPRLSVTVAQDSQGIKWYLQKSGLTTEVDSIEALMNLL